MTKAALVLFGIALIYLPGVVFAQDSAAISAADREAVMRQANTIVLRQKLVDAKAEAQRGDKAGAARLYQDACGLAEDIGSGIPEETTEAVAGLTATRLALARDAQSRGDLREADTQIKQVLNAEARLKVAPNVNEVLAFKKHNDELLALYKGRMPDTETADKIPQMMADREKAGVLVQDGKVFYEMGKFNEAEAKLTQAIELDPDNTTASYYLNLIKQDKIHRDIINHNTDTQDRMEHVEKQWVLPRSAAGRAQLSSDTAMIVGPVPYATNTLVWTGAGRQEIMAKLDHIRLENVSFDGMPLSDVLKELTKQSVIRDPERKGINFLINNNPDLSGQPVAIPTLGGGGGFGGGAFGGGGRFGGAAAAEQQAPNIDPNTGLPVAPSAESQTTEQQDIGQFIIHIPSLTDVRLADVLDAIVLVADHPIKYSIRDFAVVFSAKGPETPQLFTRVFRVDPNTFYSGLENVSSYPLGISSGGSSGTGGGGGGGASGGNNQFSTPVGVVNAFAGAGSSRQSGTTGGGGGGGGGGNQGGSGSLLSNNNQGGGGGIGGIGGGGGGGGGGNQQNAGGLAYITSQSSMVTPSALARYFFTALGVNLFNPPGKSVFFNDRLGYLFVKATESDLDTIEQALQVLNQVPPQVHIKARFIEVNQSSENQLGFDWYLGQFNMGNNVVGQGGNPGSLTVPTSAANSIGAFPVTSSGSTLANQGQNIFSSGLSPSTGSTTATITGILTNPNFQVVLHALETRTGIENLGEPEITVLSGRQTQMRATTVQTVVVGVSFQQGQSATTTTGLGTTP